MPHPRGRCAPARAGPAQTARGKGGDLGRFPAPPGTFSGPMESLLGAESVGAGSPSLAATAGASTFIVYKILNLPRYFPGALK